MSHAWLYIQDTRIKFTNEDEIRSVFCKFKVSSMIYFCNTPNPGYMYWVGNITKVNRPLGSLPAMGAGDHL